MFIGNPINLRRLYSKRWLVRRAANITVFSPLKQPLFGHLNLLRWSAEGLEI